MDLWWKICHDRIYRMYGLFSNNMHDAWQYFSLYYSLVESTLRINYSQQQQQQQPKAKEKGITAVA